MEGISAFYGLSHPDGRITTFAENLHAVFGMQYLDGNLYVLHNPKFTVFTDDPTGVGKDPRDLIRSTNPNPWATGGFNDHIPSDADAWKLSADDVAATVSYVLSTPPNVLVHRAEVRTLTVPQCRARR